MDLAHTMLISQSTFTSMPCGVDTRHISANTAISPPTVWPIFTEALRATVGQHSRAQPAIRAA